MRRRNTILIVDDIELNRAILNELFQDKHIIMEAENGQEAIELIQAHGDRLSVVLLDVVMPVMDGIEVLRQLRDSRQIEDIPVVFITAENNEETALRGYTMGVSDIITKPFNPDIVCRRVENVIELHEHKRFLEEKLQEQYIIMEQQEQKLKRANTFIIDTLSTVIEFRNCESGTHIQRIRNITEVLLKSLSHKYGEYDFTQEQISMITDASVLHDIGKIAIPEAILLKAGELTESEYSVMKTHTLIGCDILQNLGCVQDKEFFKYCYEICRYHHERWDGSGYPDGLSGDDIPVWAQIVSLADIYETLTNNRGCKSQYTHQQAVSMILNGECGAFNPEVLKCFMDAEETLRKENIEPDGENDGNAGTAILLEENSLAEQENKLSQQTLQLLETERKKYRILSNLSEDIVFDYNPKEDILQFSEKYTRVFGSDCKIERAQERLWRSGRIPGEDKEKIGKALEGLSSIDSSCKLQVRMQVLSGEFQWFEISICALWEPGNAHWESLVGRLENIHQAKMETIRLQKQISSSLLTGTYNYDTIVEPIEHYLNSMHTNTGALFLIELDMGEEEDDINASLTEEVLLQRFGENLKSLFENTSIVGYLDGNKFVAVLCGEYSQAALTEITEKICELFYEMQSVYGNIGVACFPQDGPTFESVLHKAKKALYSAKQYGKGQYAFYDDEMDIFQLPIVADINGIIY